MSKASTGGGAADGSEAADRNSLKQTVALKERPRFSVSVLLCST